MSKIRAIVEQVGRDAIIKRVGVTSPAITNAINEDMFPAAWFEEMESLCAEDGVICPRSLFAFRRNGLSAKNQRKKEKVS